MGRPTVAESEEALAARGESLKSLKERDGDARRAAFFPEST